MTKGIRPREAEELLEALEKYNQRKRKTKKEDDDIDWGWEKMPIF